MGRQRVGLQMRWLIDDPINFSVENPYLPAMQHFVIILSPLVITTSATCNICIWRLCYKHDVCPSVCPSVRVSVTLVDCDQIVQLYKWKSGTWKVGLQCVVLAIPACDYE